MQFFLEKRKQNTKKKKKNYKRTFKVKVILL